MSGAESGILAEAGRWFDADWYLLHNPDVTRVGIDAQSHYLRYGEAEGRKPSAWFDPAWYRAVYGLAPYQSPLAHFLAHRMTGRFLPRPDLYVAARLAPGDGAFDPFDRYLTENEKPERELLPDLTVIHPSGLIGPGYFRINGLHPDEHALQPDLHYCRIGVRFDARPNDVFDLAYYAADHPGLAGLGINPVTHYILEGEPSGQRPTIWFDPVWYRREYGVNADQVALGHYLAHRHGRGVSPNPLFDVSWYVARFGQEIPPEMDPFSHYTIWGALRDIAPSPGFDARGWRHRNMAALGAPGQEQLPYAARNPLIHYLRLSLN